MGRVSKLDKKTLVKYNKETNISKCLLCEKVLKGCILGNIKRHYELIHKHTFDENTPSTSTQNISIRQSTKVSGLKLNENEFIKCCVGLVTVKNIPFNIFDDELYFKQIIEPYEKQFKLDLNSENILEHVQLCANNIKNHFKRCLSKKMISLKVDEATSMSQSIVGINIQYIKDFKIVINSIGVIELRKTHTAHYLKDEMIKCLQEFDIDLAQIYSTTSDNGVNMLQASELLQQDMVDIKHEEFASEKMDDDYKLVYERLKSVLAVDRCAAHTIQLAAYDTFKDMQNKLDDCRKIVNILRSNIKDGSNPANLDMPKIDNITRWNSTFDMLESLLSLRQHINGNKVEFFIDFKIDWIFIDNFVNAFAPMVDFTKQLQAEQYIIGDFYRDWLLCEAKLKKMADNSLAVKLFESMQKGKEILLDNVSFVCGLYFDPRFNFLDSPYINDEQRKTAVVHILKTNSTLNALNGEMSVSDNEGSEYQEDVRVSTSDPYNILEEELSILTSRRVTTPNGASIRQKLDNLAYGQRMPFSADILEYWKNISFKERDLFRLAEVILAVPCSQVSLERTYSALSALLTQQHSELSSDSLNDLFIVKLNSELLEELNF